MPGPHTWHSPPHLPSCWSPREAGTEPHKGRWRRELVHNSHLRGDRSESILASGVITGSKQ